MSIVIILFIQITNNKLLVLIKANLFCYSLFNKIYKYNFNQINK